MLRVNVGLSRKVSKDFNSTGYSINLDGEITAPVSDSEAVVEQVKEFFDLAEEALDLQIQRSQGDDAMASRDEPKAQEPSNGHESGAEVSPPLPRHDRGRQNGNGWKDEPATNKQIQFLLNLGQQQKLSKRQLQDRVTEILGFECDLYELSKRDAGTVLEALTGTVARRN